MLLQIILTILIIATIPFATILLMGQHPVLPRFFTPRKHDYSVRSFTDCLHRIQAEIKDTSTQEDGTTVIMFTYQGGLFFGIHSPNPDSEPVSTVSISFFSCFNVDLADLEILERVINESNLQMLPYKTTYKPQDDGDKLSVSIHAAGLKIDDSTESDSYMKELLSGFFIHQRYIISEFQRISASEPNALVKNIMPPTRANYSILRSEIEEHLHTWDGLWWETPELTLASIIDRLTGIIPTEQARIYVNGVLAEQNATELEPLSLMLKKDIKEDDPILMTYLTIDVVEPDELMNRNVHIIFSLKEVEERLISIHLYAMQSGLPVSAFRPIGSPETLPRAFSSVIGIHRGGPDMFKAEAEYMAQEQNLIEKIKNGDAAYSFYWGKVLFTSDRFFEAAHYLQNAYDLIAPQMDNPESQQQERLEMFFDICFYLGIAYYKLGRYRDSYYFIDIIVNQHRVKWTQQYILTLLALHDPRLENLLHGLREQLVDQLNSEEDVSPVTELIDFIDRQLILVGIQQGKIDMARKALEKRLDESPEDAFALHWLAKLG